MGGGGIWHFRPETQEMDVFIRGLVNSWGHTFDPWGQSFGTDGAGGGGRLKTRPGDSVIAFALPDDSSE